MLLSAAAIAGKLLLSDLATEYLAAIRCFAAGAVIAFLATVVFPKAYREDNYVAGIATSLGLYPKSRGFLPVALRNRNSTVFERLSFQ